MRVMGASEIGLELFWNLIEVIDQSLRNPIPALLTLILCFYVSEMFDKVKEKIIIGKKYECCSPGCNKKVTKPDFWCEEKIITGVCNAEKASRVV